MKDYPRTLSELERRFATEAACLDYLAALRWPADGFVCPQCAGNQAWRTDQARAVALPQVRQADLGDRGHAVPS